MDVKTAIAGRRSIRKFQPCAVDDRSVLEIVDAAGKAPSPGNRQPWRFVVVQGDLKAEVVRLMRSKEPELPGLGLGPGGLRLSVSALEQAPVALGYPDESPGPRPRTPLDEILEWS